MNKKIGILGGGQLAMMMTQAGIKIGINDITVIDPTPNCPASKVGAKQIIASFLDKKVILELASKVDVLTYDIESVNVDALIEATNITKVYPHPKCLNIIQDKWIQREYFTLLNNILQPKFYSTSLLDLNITKKFIVKTRKGGYDGKGVWVFKTYKELNEFMKKTLLSENDIYIEEYIPFIKELAVIAYNSHDINEPIVYPITETIQENGICKKVICPTPLDSSIREEVNRIAKIVVKSFDTYGIFGIELFLTNDGKVLLNEVSPRVHNSGHYTIEATNCSQFEQHIRIITNMPTIKPEMIVPYVMMENILAKGDNTDFLLKKYKNFHWYNKNYLNFYKPLRKIGHITNKLSFQNIPYPLIYIVMGSSSDLPTVQPAIDLLNKYKIPIKVDVVSAHRSPEWMFEFGKNIESWCGKVIIAAAGGAAHLPGMLASLTPIPVIGIPVPSKYLGGKDSLLSIVEMPEGVPVATVGIGKAKNAGILALKIIGAIDEVKDIIIENKKKVDNQRKTL